MSGQSEPGRRAECPNCGAPIAWRLAQSQAAVCSYCRFAVVRSDRDLTALGKVADLVPTAAPIAVGDAGTLGGRSFRVLGRLQLDHGRGPWDEWYLGFADRSWGWLARAEGRWYVTFERPCLAPPHWDDVAPGRLIQLSATGSLPWRVVERGGSALLSAEGELPFPIGPQDSGRYADLEGPEGAFATLDFGDGSRPVQLFAGRELARDELTITQRALGPRPSERVAVERLRCPTCGAPIPIFVPSESERCGCAACGALLDHAHGALRLLVQLEPPEIRPLIALGSEGELFGARRTVIGFMQRSVRVEGELYTFREYLLHADSGYAWLVEENHHWLYVAPIAASEVDERGSSAVCRGTRYRRFARAHPVVDFVIGEFYWKVQRGDESETVDFIAPPRLISVERTDREVSWSAGAYVDRALLSRAFGLKQALPKPIGVAPAQPNPHDRRGTAYVFGLLALCWFLLAFSYELGNRKTVLVDTSLLLPQLAAGAWSATSAPQQATIFSPPFEVRRGPTTLEVALTSPIDNGWVSVEASLVPEAGGTPRELPLVVEHYQGFSDGASWQEGSTETEGYFGRVAAGRYSVRFVGAWEPYPKGAQALPPPVQLRVTQGARSHACMLGALALIALPYLLSRMRRFAFELRRREHESP